MTKKLNCYLRPYRRRWGLTQQELATIIVGAKSRTLISRLENGACQPSLATAFALQLVFGVQADELFPAQLEEVKDEVVARAYELFDQLQGNSSKANKLKLDFLEDMFARTKQGIKHDTHL